MLIQEALQKFGLTQKEAKIYLACLELGSSTVQEIAKKSGIIRSTSYSVLESLIRKNLVSSIEHHNVKHYISEDPQKIWNLEEERKQYIKSVFPELKEIYGAAKTRPRIKYYEGLSGIKDMYNQILKEKDLKEYLIIASEQDWLKMDKDFFEDFKKRRAETKIKVRLILETSPIALERKKKAKETFSEIKLLPKDISCPFSSGVYIFKNKVIFIAYKKDLIAVVVESKEIADLQRMMFEFIWKALH